MKVCVCSTCPMAGEPQPAEDFYRLNKARDGLQSWCKTCMKAARQRERAAKPEREREYCRQSYQRIKADPERYAIHSDSNRQRKRQALGITPDRYRVGSEGSEVMVFVAPIRAAVAESGLNWSEIGYRVGIDEGAIRRGLQQEKMNAGKACRILEAIGSSPAEVGL